MKVFVDISGSKCMGIWPKAPILKAFGAHIFFDDQEKHVLGGGNRCPCSARSGTAYTGQTCHSSIVHAFDWPVFEEQVRG